MEAALRKARNVRPRGSSSLASWAASLHGDDDVAVVRNRPAQACHGDNLPAVVMACKTPEKQRTLKSMCDAPLADDISGLAYSPTSSSQPPVQKQARP